MAQTRDITHRAGRTRYRKKHTDASTRTLRTRIGDLLRKGTSGIDDIPTRRRTAALNALLWGLVVGSGSAVPPLLFFLGPSGLLHLAPPLFFLAVLGVNARGHFAAARLALAIGSSSIIFVFGSLFGASSGMLTIVLVLTAIPFVITSLREPLLLAITASLPPLAWLLCRILDYEFFGLEIVSPEAAANLYWIFVPIAHTFLVSLVWLFDRHNGLLVTELEDASRLNTTVLDNIDDALLVADATGTIIHANPTSLKLFADGPTGARPVLGQPLEDFVANGSCEDGPRVPGAPSIPFRVRECASSAGGRPIRVVVLRDLRADQETARRERDLYEELRRASRRAGMAEIARSVLHNMGNVLNSVAVSTSLVGERLRGSRSQQLDRAVQLLEDERSTPEKRARLLRLLEMTAEQLDTERAEVAGELGRVLSGVGQVREIIHRQNEISAGSVALERCTAQDITDDVLMLTEASFAEQGLELECGPLDEGPPAVWIDRVILTEVVVDLLEHARHSVTTRSVRLEAWADDDSLFIAIVEGSGADDQSGQSHSGPMIRRNASLPQVEEMVRTHGAELTVQKDGASSALSLLLRWPQSPAPHALFS